MLWATTVGQSPNGAVTTDVSRCPMFDTKLCRMSVIGNTLELPSMRLRLDTFAIKMRIAVFQTSTAVTARMIYQARTLTDSAAAPEDAMAIAISRTPKMIGGGGISRVRVGDRVSRRAMQKAFWVREQRHHGWMSEMRVSTPTSKSRFFRGLKVSRQAAEKVS